MPTYNGDNTPNKIKGSNSVDTINGYKANDLL
jgi:hypothetical protein